MEERFEHILYEKRGHIAYVTFNRPDVLNALHNEAHEELAEAFDDFRQDDDAWIAIITGAGDRAFCAGFDLKAAARNQEVSRQRRQQGLPLNPMPTFAGITKGFDCPKPLIAAVNGYAMGGGVETILACDIVVAAEHARFALSEPRVGLIPGAGGIHRLVRQIPLKQAMGLLLTGRQIGAEEALRYGIVNEVVPLSELMDAAERWAEQILSCAPLSVRLIKQMASEGLEQPLEEALAGDFDRAMTLLDTEDFREGPLAFAEKRKPEWKGQ